MRLECELDQRDAIDRIPQSVDLAMIATDVNERGAGADPAILRRDRGDFSPRFGPKPRRGAHVAGTMAGEILRLEVRTARRNGPTSRTRPRLGERFPTDAGGAPIGVPSPAITVKAAVIGPADEQLAAFAPLDLVGNRSPVCGLVDGVRRPKAHLPGVCGRRVPGQGRASADMCEIPTSEPAARGVLAGIDRMPPDAGWALSRLTVDAEGRRGYFIIVDGRRSDIGGGHGDG